LADFGFAKKLETTTSSFCGTPDYIAYEIILSKPYSFGVDWWSLGVLVFELCSGKTPFRANDSEGIYKNIEKCNIQWVELIKGPIKTLVAGLLQPDSTRRLGAKGVKGSDWFSNIDWEKLGKRGLNPPIILPCRTPENMEKEKVTKGGSANYNDILGDTHSFDNKLGDPFKGVFDGF
jgi:protein kinase A